MRSKCSKVLGNTEPKPSNPAKCWVFTLHLKTISGCFNTIEEWYEQIDIHKFKKYRFAMEYGDSGLKPHIQGGFILKEKKRLEQVKKILKDNTVHLEIMRGSWQDQEYCGKEGHQLYTNDRKVRLINKDMLWEWQLELINWFGEYCDMFDRTIYWIKGDCQGKSMVCKYLIDNEDAIVVEGKNSDILYGVSEYVKAIGNSPKVVIVDIPKVNQGAVSYQALEKIKNGFFFNSKYESSMCRFDPCHILVMSNEYPDLEAYVQDRWRIYTVDNKKLTKRNLTDDENTSTEF